MALAAAGVGTAPGRRAAHGRVLAALLLTALACGAAADDVTIRAPGGQVIAAEVADTPAARARGLMFRRAMAPDRGMLFDFGRAASWPFWMKNTLLALDMIWIDGGGAVVHVEHDVPPCPAGADCPIYESPVAARFVLELNAGRARALGIAPGARLDLGDAGARP